MHHGSWGKFVEDADSRYSNTLLQTRTRTVRSLYSSSHMLTLISMGCNRQSPFFCALSSSQECRLLTRLPSQQLRAGFRPDCLLGIMRSAPNVSPFCRMIGEALTSAPAVMSLAKARQVYADDQLFAAPAIRLAGPALFRHLPVVWSVLRFTFSVVGFAFSRDPLGTPGFKDMSESRRTNPRQNM